jgi:signal transduction histidine kinase
MIKKFIQLITRQTIKVKILIIVGFSIFYIILLSIGNSYFLINIKDIFKNLNNNELLIKDVTNNISIDIAKLNQLAIFSSITGEVNDKTILENENNNKQILNQIQYLKKLIKIQEDKKLLELIHKITLRYKANSQIALNLHTSFKENFDDGIDEIYGLYSISKKINSELDILRDYSIKNFNHKIVDLYYTMNLSFYLTIILAIISSILFIIFNMIISYSITVPLKKFQNGLLGFFQYINSNSTKIELLDDKREDEIGTMAKIINLHIIDGKKNIDNKTKALKENENKLKKINQDLKNKNENIKLILDTQPAIVIITNGIKISSISNKFFQIFDYENTEDFNKKHNCISELFIDKKEKSFLVPIMKDLKWINYIYKYPNKIHNVYIKDKFNNERIFDIKISEKVLQKDIIIVLTDITELNKSNQKLEFTLDEIKQQQQIMLDQSRSAAMGEMIAMIAHQWRQPLGAISATANNLLLEIMLNPSFNKNIFLDEIKKIDSFSQHLSKTIDDFRNFFKIKKSKENTSFAKMLNESLKIIETSLKNKNIKIDINIESNNNLKTYSNEIKQVILNIIKNAEDAFIDNNITDSLISIDIISLIEFEVLIIKDNAGGIPEDILPRIFEPYFSTKTKKDGTGLGLYMSKTIIEEHCKGKIKVSNKNNGVEFKIYIPCLKLID